MSGSDENKQEKRKVRFSETPEVQFFDGSAPASKRRALDPMQVLEGEISGVCLAEGSLDAGACAARRAAARRHELLAGFEDGGCGPYMDDIKGAEEDYDDPEEMFNDAGVPWEPFHLKREREEGYFDEDGNYVEYKTNDVDDAWADGLANVEVDEEWLARVMSEHGRGSAAARVGAREEAELGPEEILSHKRRIVDMLLPGENVLQALRRLARLRQPNGGTVGLGTPASEPLTRHPRALGSQAMPAAVRERFQELTGLSNVLMDQGVYSVHSMTREQLEGSMASSSSSGGGGTSVGAGTSSGTTGRAGAGGGPAPALLGANGTTSANAGLQLAQRLLAAAGSGTGGAGKNGASNGSRGGGGEGVPAAVWQPVAVDAEEDIFGGDPAGGAAPAGSGGAHQQGVQQPSSQQDAREVQPSNGPAAQQQELQGKQEQAATLPQRDASDDVSMFSMQDEHQEGVALQQQAAATTGCLPPPPTEGLDGFELDAASGLLYNSAMGCYYNPQQGLFGDASSGLWYRFDASSGEYQLASKGF